VDERVVLAIDGNSLVHRSYHAQARTGMHTVDGRPAWAVRGLLTQLVAAVDRIRPVAVVVGFDDPSRSERREQLPQYKAHRTEKLETLVEQLGPTAQVELFAKGGEAPVERSTGSQAKDEPATGEVIQRRRFAGQLPRSAPVRRMNGTSTSTPSTSLPPATTPRAAERPHTAGSASPRSHPNTS